MPIKMNLPDNNYHIKNLAFIRALLIINTINQMDITYSEKENLRKEVLNYLSKT